MIRRVNFYGGPGVGKSTLAARFFALWKQRGSSVELIPEIIKQNVYAKTPVRGWEYILTFAQQLDAEYLPLNYGVQWIVTDSPLFIQCMYAGHHECQVTKQMAVICFKFEEEFPSINFLVERQFPFKPEGRFQVGEAEAIKVDRMIEDLLGCYGIPYERINPDMTDMQLESIMHHIEE